MELVTGLINPATVAVLAAGIVAAWLVDRRLGKWMHAGSRRERRLTDAFIRSMRRGMWL